METYLYHIGLAVAVLNAVIAQRCFERGSDELGWANLIFSASNTAAWLNNVIL